MLTASGQFRLAPGLAVSLKVLSVAPMLWDELDALPATVHPQPSRRKRRGGPDPMS